MLHRAGSLQYVGSFETLPDDFPTTGEWMSIAARYGVAADQALRIDQIARSVGGKGLHLARVIWHESRFQPKAQFGQRLGAPFKPGVATGLIQFTPTLAGVLGTTTRAIYDMSFDEQLDLVERYLQHVASGKGGGGAGPLDTQEKMALAVFYPAWRELPLDTPLPPKIAERNKVATIGEYVAKVLGQAPPVTTAMAWPGPDEQATAGFGGRVCRGGTAAIAAGVIGTTLAFLVAAGRSARRR